MFLRALTMPSSTRHTT